MTTYWPAYKSWYRQKKPGDINPQALKQGQRQLATVMPEMLPLYESFLDASNDCPVAAQFLTGFQPPAYLVSCAQAVLLDEEPVLMRNYDLSPDLSEKLSETMSYHWPEEKAWRHSFADFRVSEKTVNLVQQASLATVYGDAVEQTDADLSLPARLCSSCCKVSFTCQSQW